MKRAYLSLGHSVARSVFVFAWVSLASCSMDDSDYQEQRGDGFWDEGEESREVDAGVTDAGDDASPTEYCGGALGEYASLPAMTLSGPSGSADVRTAWNEPALYVAFDVTDSVLLPSTGTESSLWNGDGVEVMIDAAFDRSATTDQDDYRG